MFICVCLEIDMIVGDESWSTGNHKKCYFKRKKIFTYKIEIKKETGNPRIK